MEVSKKMTIPLFPLNAVLFPGGVLPLRIFEPRYLDMVSDCMKTDGKIGVVLIASGEEAGQAAQVHDVGTLAHISYWHKRSDGMLGITLTGEQRFQILSTTVHSNQLTVADITLLDAPAIAPTAVNAQLVALLKQIMARLEPPYTTMTMHYDDANWVTARLVELLPLSLHDKQQMLLMSDVDDRIRYLQPRLVKMEMLQD